MIYVWREGDRTHVRRGLELLAEVNEINAASQLRDSIKIWAPGKQGMAKCYFNGRTRGCPEADRYHSLPAVLLECDGDADVGRVKERFEAAAHTGKRGYCRLHAVILSHEHWSRQRPKTLTPSGGWGNADLSHSMSATDVAMSERVRFKVTGVIVAKGSR